MSLQKSTDEIAALNTCISQPRAFPIPLHHHQVQHTYSTSFINALIALLILGTQEIVMAFLVKIQTLVFHRLVHFHPTSEAQITYKQSLILLWIFSLASAFSPNILEAQITYKQLFILFWIFIACACLYFQCASPTLFSKIDSWCLTSNCVFWIIWVVICALDHDSFNVSQMNSANCPP